MFYREPLTMKVKPTFASAADAAKMLGGHFGPHDVARLVEEGEIEGTEHDGRLLVVVTSLEAYGKKLAR